MKINVRDLALTGIMTEEGRFQAITVVHEDSMTISSRTPEGEHGECPICHAHVVIEPSILIGDAPCPRCGHLLWFFQTPEQVHLFDTRKTKTKRFRLIQVIAEQIGVSPAKLLISPDWRKDLCIDSLEMVELMMEIEEISESDEQLEVD